MPGPGIHPRGVLPGLSSPAFNPIPNLSGLRGSRLNNIRLKVKGYGIKDVMPNTKPGHLLGFVTLGIPSDSINRYYGYICQ